MKNSFTKELAISFIIIILSILLLNPFEIWMPDMLIIAIIAVTLVAFAVFASFILREDARDERDVAHRMLAGRVAFMSGSSVLMLGIVYQAYNHSLDAWLVMALLAMILAKIGTHIYSDRNY